MTSGVEQLVATVPTNTNLSNPLSDTDGTDCGPDITDSGDDSDSSDDDATVDDSTPDGSTTDAKADTNTDGGISFDELLAFQGAASTGSGCDHGGSSETDSFSTTLVANVLRKSGNGWGQPFYTF